MPRFNPLADFVGGQSSALGLQSQRQGIAREKAAAPVRNELAQIQLQQARTGQEREGQQQILRRTKLLNQGARAIEVIDPSQWSQAIPRVVQFLGDQGVDAQDLVKNITPENLTSFIAQTDELLRDPDKLLQLTGQERERQSLMNDLAPALNDQGQIDQSKLDATSKAAAIKLRLIPGAVGSGAITTATTPGLPEKVGASEGLIAGEKEGAKLGKQLEFKPKIQAAVKEAEALAKARGETNIDLVKAQAALPGIEEVVGQLKILSEKATFTLKGKGFNQIAKQFGYSTDGSTARASMISIIDNQILPMLKPIFGAAFTKSEGDALKKTMADPDSTPDSRKAQLDAFLAQVKRNIETKKKEKTGFGVDEQEADDFINSILGQ